MSPSDLDVRAISAARAARASVGPLGVGAEPPLDFMVRRRRHRTRNRVAALAGAAALVAAGFAGFAELGSDRAKVSTTPADQPPVSSAEFCRQAPRPGDERPASYVGSDEHVADLDALVAVAPAPVHDDLTRFRNYVDADVEPARPDSRLT